MADLQLDLQKTALLCMDVHNFIVDQLPGDRREKFIGSVKRALDGARTAGVAVIYVGAERRADFSSARNKFTRGRAAPTDPAQVAERRKFVERLAPLESEPVVHKPRISAFYGSALDSMLRARDIDTLLLTGIATNFVVESTARAAVDMDYRVIILEDCVTAADEAVHRAALASMEPLAEIVTSGRLSDQRGWQIAPINALPQTC